VKVYIAGPMTGRKHYNHAAFMKAKEQWEALGHEAFTPFESNSIVWLRHHGRDFDPFTDRCEYGDPMLAEMMAENLRAVCLSDAIVLLDEWQGSKGSRAEIIVGKLAGKLFYKWDNVVDKYDAFVYTDINLTPIL
jgi:hypothetical protein